MAAAVLGFLALGIGLPIVVSGTDRLELHSAALVAETRDRFSITTPVMLQGVPGVVVERGILALSDRHYKRPMSGEEEAALLASGGARLVLESATIVIDANAQPGQAEAMIAPLAKSLGELNFETLAIRRSTLVFKSETGRATVVGDVTAEIVPKRKYALTAKGSVTVRGHKLALDAVLGLLSEKRAAGARQQPLKFSVKGALVDASFDGAVDFAEGGLLRGQAELGMRNIRDAARAAGLGWPHGSGFTAFKVKGPVTWGQQVLAFDKAQMQMDGNEAAGTLSLSVAGGRPMVGGTFALQTLDLSGYLNDWRRESARNMIEDFIGPGPFALPLIKHFDADVRISASRVRTGGQELGRSAATLSLKNGKLLADVAEIEFAEAEGTGQITVDVNGPGPRYTVRGKMSGLDLSRLVPDAPGMVSIRGRGDVTTDVTATGESLADLVRTVTGKVSLAMPSGGRLGIDLKSLMMAAQKQPQSGWGAARGVTQVDSLQGRIMLTDGVVYTEAFTAALGDALLTASGGGNLRNGQVDLRLSMATRTAQDRPVQAGTQRGPMDALVLRGPWHEPMMRADRPVPASSEK